MTNLPYNEKNIYSSHLVQYAHESASRECLRSSEILASGYALCKHSSEQKVRMPSTSHPSSIRWWQCSQIRTLSISYSLIMSSRQPSMTSSSTIRMASRFS